MEILKFLLLSFILVFGLDFFLYACIYLIYFLYLLDMSLPIFICMPINYFLELCYGTKIYNIVIVDLIMRASIILYIIYAIIKYIKGKKSENKT